MNKDQIKGRLKETAGKARKALGDTMDDTGQQGRGLAQEAEGKLQKNWGDLKDEAGKKPDNADSMRGDDSSRRRPRDS